MKCDQCGCTFPGHEAVTELSNEATSTVNALGQSTTIVRITLCSQCAADRAKNKAALSYVMIVLAIVAALAMLAMIYSVFKSGRL